MAILMNEILPKNFSLNEKYDVMFLIKRGSYSETYRVKGEDGKLYFLKLYNNAKLHRSAFDIKNNILEIKLLKSINHPNIVSYKDNGELIFKNKRFSFLVTDFVIGETLAEQITRKPISDIYDIKQIIIGILNGLNYMHSLSKSIIHNEITPQNIMIDLSSDIPKSIIIDFGYARYFHQSTKTFYKEGLNLNYVASECFNNSYSPQSDLFSVGALMYHLLFAIPPWFKEISKYKADRIKMEDVVLSAREKPLAIPNIEGGITNPDESLLKILTKALHHDLNYRFQSATEFIQALNGEIGIDELTYPKKTDKIKSVTVEKGKGFSAIAGMKSLKDRLQNDVINVIENPEEYKKHNLGLPNGLLLYGPPGCGKTFFAEKFAEEASYNYIKVISSDIASIYIHGSQEKIGKLFDEARKKAPSILYFDELDAMVPNREHTNNQSQSGEVNEFLSQLDNIGDSGVFVIGSTNKPELIDKAVLRAGRLEKWFYIPPPDFDARKAMFELYLKDRPLDFGIDYNKLAELTENYVSSDLKLLIDETSRKTIRDKLKRISMETLTYIIENQKPTVSITELKKYELIRKKIEEGVEDDNFNNRPRMGFKY
jgi:transitional endoplasmic reticulum ATPase